MSRAGIFFIILMGGGWFEFAVPLEAVRKEVFVPGRAISGFMGAW
jgi:hypothetical protein